MLLSFAISVYYPPFLYGLWQVFVVVVQSTVSNSASPWTAVRQASLSFTISQSLLKPMSTESVMPSNHLIFCHPFSSCLQSFPALGSFQMSWLFASGDQSIGALASVLTVNIQGWFPVGLTGLTGSIAVTGCWDETGCQDISGDVSGIFVLSSRGDVT